MVWAPCKQGPCCHIQPTLRPGSPSAQAHPFWEINTNLNKVTSTELDLSKNVLIPENVVVAFFFQPVRLKSMEKKSPEMKSWGELFFMNPFALISLETQASTNIEHSETLQVRSQPWFQPLLFSQPPVFRKSVMVMKANAVCDTFANCNCKDTSNNWMDSLWWWHPFWYLWWPFQNAIKMLSFSKIFCQSYFFFGAAFFFFFFAFSSSSLTNSGGGL